MIQNTTSLGTCIRNAAVAVALCIVLYAVMASWLTAHELIRVTTELAGYYSAFGMVLACGVLYYVFDARRTKLSRFVTILGIIGALTVVVISCQYSDATFMFWKLRVVKPGEWQHMVSDLLALDKKGQQTNTKININHDQAPSSFSSLGLTSDCMGGHAGVGNDPAVFYGVKSRRWGLEIGSNDFSHGHWATFKRVQIGYNAWLFVGPDD